MEREIRITDYGQDYGYNRYHARHGSETIISTNDLDDLIQVVQEFLQVFTIAERERRREEDSF